MICLECGRPAQARNLCPSHYQRLRLTGSIGRPEVQSYGAAGCCVDGCANTHRAKGYCAKHYMRLVNYNDPVHVPARQRGAIPGYGGAHDRVRAIRGSASDHCCAHCGGLATQWAYDHTDPNRVVDGRGRPYSLDPNRYMAMCIPCHRRLDK